VTCFLVEFVIPSRKPLGKYLKTGHGCLVTQQTNYNIILLYSNCTADKTSLNKLKTNNSGRTMTPILLKIIQCIW